MSIQESKVYLGIDVASKHLDLFFPDTGKLDRIRNDAEAVKALCVRIQGQSQFIFVMEAIGGYESLVSECLKGASDGRFKRGLFDRKGMGHSDRWILRSSFIGVSPMVRRLDMHKTQGIVHGDFAASCGEGLSHRAKVGIEGSRPLWRAAPHSDFGLHDARVAPLQSPSLREDHFVVIACELLSSMF